MIKLILVIFLALLLRLYNLGQSFWLDEAAQVIESARPLNEQLNIGADFHPPLYHLLLHFWMYLGNSEIWIRLLSVGLGLGVVFITYKTAKLLFSENVALVSSFLVAISPYLIWYSQEARPYILFVFLSLISTFFLLKKN
ncbi:glycosyltransferase family 39 protein, partial [Candidatus Roizmanbacteria bacterium]|nr:glycosyltransferase family 39 protein [Candidatus Roizmanbacteria bacterium]